MNKEDGISVLREVIASGEYSMSGIARELGVDPSQVSKIASGKFARMTGHALDVCKFAYKIKLSDQVREKKPALVNELNELTNLLVQKNPQAAKALVGMLQTMVNQQGQ